MFHAKRIWCVQQAESVEDLAEWLANHTLCCCCGFELGGYLFLNDSTSADGAQEYAICKKPAGADEIYRQIESITFGWCSYEKALRYIRDILTGRYDDLDFARSIQPRLQTPQEHGHCHYSA